MVEHATRWLASTMCVVGLILTYRVIVPGLVNSQHDSAIILAIIFAVAAPPAVAVLLYSIWKGDNS